MPGTEAGGVTRSPDEAVLRGVLDTWQRGIDEHRPDQVAEIFSDDAVFQGLRPYTVGRAGVAAYYAAQPSDTTVTYRIMATRRMADDVVLGWVAADFTFTDSDRAPIAVNLTVVLRREAAVWRIGHYHVSPRIETE